MGVRNKRVELYRSLDEITVYRFDKAIRGDLRYLAKVDNVTYVSIGEAYEVAWKEIINEYVEKSNASIFIQAYLIKGELNYLISRLDIVPFLVQTARSTTDTGIFKDSIREIELWGFPVNVENDLDLEMTKILTVLKNSKNKIQRRKQELKEITGSQKIPSIYEQKVQLHTFLGIDINLKETTMLEWIAYWKELDEEIRRRKKSQNTS